MLDITSSYPSNEIVCNVSKQTTSKELISIAGVSEEIQRLEGYNLSGGKANAVEIVTSLFAAPQLSEWLVAFNKQNEVAM